MPRRITLEASARAAFLMRYALKELMTELVQGEENEFIGELGQLHANVLNASGATAELIEQLFWLPEKVRAALVSRITGVNENSRGFRTYQADERTRLINELLNEDGDYGNDVVSIRVSALGIKTNERDVRLVRNARGREMEEAKAAASPSKKGRSKSRGGRSMTDDEKAAVLHLFSVQGFTDENEIKRILAKELGFPDVKPRSIRMVVVHVLKEEQEKLGEEREADGPTPTT